MRFLRVGLIAAALLGCSDDSSDPAQPRDDNALSGSVRSAGPGGQASAADDHRKGPKGDTPGFFVTGGGVSVPVGTGFTVIQKLSLPSGKYIATASAVLVTEDAAAHPVNCIFMVNGLIQGDAAKGSGNVLSLPLTIGFAIEAATDLELTCATDVAGVVVSQTSHITAVGVDRLTIQDGAL
jgi:hypothetical protein